MAATIAPSPIVVPRDGGLWSMAGLRAMNAPWPLCALVLAKGLRRSPRLKPYAKGQRPGAANGSIARSCPCPDKEPFEPVDKRGGNHASMFCVKLIADDGHLAGSISLSCVEAVRSI